MSWSYSEHPFAFGGNGVPEAYLSGASHRNAGAIRGANRNAYAGAPGAGQAASLPRIGNGTPSNDKPHSLALDGHAYSEVSNHPDGRFAQNTAISSDNSLRANFEHFLSQGAGAVLKQVLQPYEVGGRRVRGLTFSDYVPEDDKMPLSRLTGNRADRLNDEPELVVSMSIKPSNRLVSLLTKEWSSEQLGLLALSAYGAYSIAKF